MCVRHWFLHTQAEHTKASRKERAWTKSVRGGLVCTWGPTSPREPASVPGASHMCPMGKPRVVDIFTFLSQLGPERQRLLSLPKVSVQSVVELTAGPGLPNWCLSNHTESPSEEVLVAVG